MARFTPLALTLFRFLLGPLFIAVRRGHVTPWALLGIAALAILTDWLDGFLARRWKVVSSAGKLLDPCGDAIFCLCVFYDAWTTDPGLVPGWVLGVLMAREAIVTFILRPLALTRRLVMAAHWLGKTKTVLQFIVIVSYIVLLLPAGRDSAFVSGVAHAAVWLVLAASLASGLLYVQKTWSAFRVAAPAAQRS